MESCTRTPWILCSTSCRSIHCGSKGRGFQDFMPQDVFQAGFELSLLFQGPLGPFWAGSRCVHVSRLDQMSSLVLYWQIRAVPGCGAACMTVFHSSCIRKCLLLKGWMWFPLSWRTLSALMRWVAELKILRGGMALHCPQSSFQIIICSSTALSWHFQRYGCVEQPPLPPL